MSRLVRRIARALALLAAVFGVAPLRGRADTQAAAATYVRTDTDETLVVAPRLRLRAPVAEETHLNLLYAVDVWTSASIDIMTSASQVPVTEQRDELDLSVDHELSDITATAAYRFSTEPDYESHGLSGGFGYDFADNSATLALGLSASRDVVGKAGDPEFARGVGTLGARLSFTQVLDVDSIVQAIYELGRSQGYLASAYRYVAIGGQSVAGCTSPSPAVFPAVSAPDCPPEVNPSTRLRHALSVYGRRSLTESLSLGAGYRFYLDDWGVVSHTARAELGLMLGHDTTLSGRYRFYTQGDADHYKPVYMVLEPYVTSDKELSSMSSLRLGVELEHDFVFDDDRKLGLSISAAPIFYSYDNFLPLDSITALELNLALGFAM